MKSELIHVRSPPGLHCSAGARQEVGTELFWVFSGYEIVCVCIWVRTQIRFLRGEQSVVEKGNEWETNEILPCFA